MRVLTSNIVALTVAMLVHSMLFCNGSPAAEVLLQRASTNDGRFVAVLTGEITEGDARKIRILVRSNNISSLIVRSPGGLISEAISIANVIDQFGLAVQAQVQCASACPLLLLASRNRSATPNTQIGFHRARTQNGEAYRATIELANVLRRLGVSAEIIGHMVTNGPNEMYWLNRSQISAIDIRITQSLDLSSRRDQNFINMFVNNFLGGLGFFGADVYDAASVVLFDLSISETASVLERQARYKRFEENERLQNYNESKIIKFFGYVFGIFSIFSLLYGICYGVGGVIISVIRKDQSAVISAPAPLVQSPQSPQSPQKAEPVAGTVEYGGGSSQGARAESGTLRERNPRAYQRVEKVCQSCGTVLRLPAGRLGDVKCPSCSALAKFRT